ncbi:chain length determinant protein EpsF [Inhella inkyongensis]|uniref:Chain length determinant protein EpsF n=1 Tax=Inhella inkyongensis TaxID=392593 RepID=A0A840S7C7_9BURK|nr:chain length determinant protein EpsF [Inhella inkyongensis]MBB5204360.1 chain length determinant protein EpsF [Inhella inkyongensis]
MNFGRLIAILGARWQAALGVLCLTVLTTLVVSLLMPKQYEAVASVVVDVKPDPIAGLATGMALPSYMATQVDIMTSDRVALRVVQNLKLTELPQIREDWQAEAKGEGSIEIWLAERLKKKLEVRPSRESNVIVVGYSAPEPRFAAALANAWVQAYLDTVLELRVEPAKQYSRFFDQRIKEQRALLEEAQAKLSAFQKQSGIVATDERLDVETARLNELSSQLVGLQAVASDSNSRMAQANSGAGDRMQEVLQNPVVAGLKADISRLEAKLQELGARLGERHPQVIELKASLNEMRQRLEVEVRRVTGGVTVSASINRQRESTLRAELQAQRDKVLQMKQVRDEGIVLVRDVEAAQRLSDALLQRQQQSSLESQTTQSNVNQLAMATAPTAHASPKILLNLAVSLALGGFLAFGVALVLEMLDRRVRGRADLTELLGLEVLGSLPAADALARPSRPWLRNRHTA